VYVIPQYNDIKSRLIFINLAWNGVLFINDGNYKKGIFKFVIKIPTSYPSNPPIVIFQTKIIHSLIDYESGILNIEVNFI
jgi:ubiquitin-protein ligase